jgi:hypothetical protein
MREKVKEFLMKGEKISEIIKKHPELLEEVDKIFEEFKIKTLQISVTPPLQKFFNHFLKKFD